MATEFPEFWDRARFDNDDVYISSEDLRSILKRVEYWKDRAQTAWKLGDMDFATQLALRSELEVYRGADN